MEAVDNIKGFHLCMCLVREELWVVPATDLHLLQETGACEARSTEHSIFKL